MDGYAVQLRVLLCDAHSYQSRIVGAAIEADKAAGFPDHVLANLFSGTFPVAQESFTHTGFSKFLAAEAYRIA